jgi:hypothetical protein
MRYRLDYRVWALDDVTCGAVLGHPSNESVPMRADRVPDACEVALNARLPRMDGVFAEAMGTVMRGDTPGHHPGRGCRGPQR